MAPEFFALLGIRAQGVGFETVLWLLAMAAFGFVLSKPLRIRARFDEGALFYLVGGGGVVWSLLRLLSAWRGQLYFEEPMALPTYGVAMGVGFGVSGWLLYREAGRSPSSPGQEAIVDLMFWILISSMVGARVLFIITQVPYFVSLCQGADGLAPDCTAVLRFWEGGLVWYGGLLGALVGGALWASRRRTSFFEAADLVIPYVGLGHFVGRLGCVAAGCCWGGSCPTGVAVTYPIFSDPWNAHFEAADGVGKEWLLDHAHSFAVHPVQLYEGVGDLAIFAFLALYLRPRKRFSGHLVLAYLPLYALLRFTTEIFRGDALRGFVVTWRPTGIQDVLGIPHEAPVLLSTSQAVAVVTAAVSAAAIWWISRRLDAPSPETTGDT